MPLVHVIHARFESEGRERPKTADAQHDFLPNARVVVAAVELVGNGAIFRTEIFRDVGIEENQAHPAHIQQPDFDLDRAIGEIYLDANFPVVRVGCGQNRECIEVTGGIAFLLPAIGIQILPKVAVLIQKRHADERKVEVARRFQVVAGEDAEAAGINRKALGQTVFRGEVGDEFSTFATGRPLHVGVIALTCQVVLVYVTRVGGGSLERGLRNPIEHYDRVITSLFPDGWVQAAEESANDRFPTPDDVVCKLGHTRQSGWDCGTHQKLAKRLNFKRHG